MNRHPHVRTLITFDGEPEPEPEPADRVRPHRGIGVAVVVAALAIAATFAARTPSGEALAAYPSPAPVSTRTAQPCAPGVLCSPSAEVAACGGKTLGVPFPEYPCGPGGGYRPLASSTSGPACTLTRPRAVE